MHNIIYKYISESGIDKSICDEVMSLFRLQEVKAGDIILEVGENTHVVCFILQGIVRGYYLDENGNDVTKCFSKEKEWCCVYNYLDDGPAGFYVEALENCILAEIKVSDIHELMVKYPSINTLYQKLINKAFLKVEEKGASFQMMDGKERYLLFRDKNPDICSRVKQEYIASYLGITPSSLSRIRKNL